MKQFDGFHFASGDEECLLKESFYVLVMNSAVE